MSFMDTLKKLNDKIDTWIINFRRTWKPRLAEWKRKREELRKKYGYNEEDHKDRTIEKLSFTVEDDNYDYIVIKRKKNKEKKKDLNYYYK